MEKLELRKLQVTGGASYTVSLPKQWVRQQGLKVGDVVAFIPRTDSSLTLLPHQKASSKPDRAAEVSLSPLKDQDREEILRNFVAHYLAGYDVIKISFPPSAKPEVRTYLKEAARRMFVGAEIIEESKTELIVQCLSSYGDLPAPKVIARMSLISKLMLRDAVETLRSRDTALSEEVVKRDDEVDRFYLFMIRQLTMAVTNRNLIREIGLSDPRDCLVYRIVSKGLERIADHAATIARISASVDNSLPKSLIDDLNRVSNLTSSVLEDALGALSNLDAAKANGSVQSAKRLLVDADRVTGKLFEFHLSQETIVGMRLALESLKRISEYSEDIAEMAINLTARRQDLYQNA